MEIDYVAIGKRIQKARKKKHMTQRVLAESVDISASHLSNIERGKKPVGLLTLLKICNALNITADGNTGKRTGNWPQRLWKRL